MQEDILREVLNATNGNQEEAVTRIFEINEQSLEKPQNPVPLEQGEEKCAGYVVGQTCECMCHSKGNVFPVMPCCYTCPKCGQRVVSTMKKEHESPPKNENPVPLFCVDPVPKWPVIQPVVQPCEDISFEQVCHKVACMISDNEATKLASKYGLNIVYASWEDNARDKNSSYVCATLSSNFL